jgi:hypothetical protein
MTNRVKRINISTATILKHFVILFTFITFIYIPNIFLLSSAYLFIVTFRKVRKFEHL